MSRRLHVNCLTLHRIFKYVLFIEQKIKTLKIFGPQTLCMKKPFGYRVEHHLDTFKRIIQNKTNELKTYYKSSLIVCLKTSFLYFYECLMIHFKKYINYNASIIKKLLFIPTQLDEKFFYKLLISKKLKM